MKTDNELRQDVEMELEWDPTVDARDIGVAAKNGVVTLTGQVPNYIEKWRAEHIAKRVAGVVGLANDIEVKPSDERTDTDIAEAAILTLKLAPGIPADRVKVIVEHGWITLEGKVDWYYQKSSAESAIRHLAGVKGVRNAIAIAPKVTPSEVRGQIEAAFKRSAQVDARHISIETQDRKVILRGTVRSWSEFNEAETAAWAAPGVSQVENRLIVAYTKD